MVCFVFWRRGEGREEEGEGNAGDQTENARATSFAAGQTCQEAIKLHLPKPDLDDCKRLRAQESAEKATRKFVKTPNPPYPWWAR